MDRGGRLARGGTVGGCRDPLRPAPWPATSRRWSLSKLQPCDGRVDVKGDVIRDGDRFSDLRTLARLEHAAGCLLPEWADRRGVSAARTGPHHTAIAPLEGVGDHEGTA